MLKDVLTIRKTKVALTANVATLPKAWNRYCPAKGYATGMRLGANIREEYGGIQL